MEFKYLWPDGKIRGMVIHKAIERWNDKRERNTEKLTHRRIAEELGVSPSYWSQVLCGIIKPSESLLIRFDNLLDEYGIDLIERN